MTTGIVSLSNYPEANLIAVSTDHKVSIVNSTRAYGRSSLRNGFVMIGKHSLT